MKNKFRTTFQFFSCSTAWRRHSCSCGSQTWNYFIIRWKVWQIYRLTPKHLECLFSVVRLEIKKVIEYKVISLFGGSSESYDPTVTIALAPTCLYKRVEFMCVNFIENLTGRSRKPHDDRKLKLATSVTRFLLCRRTVTRPSSTSIIDSGQAPQNNEAN